jgi:hypothetical protein
MKKQDLRNLLEDVLTEMAGDALDDEEIVEIAEEAVERVARKFSNDIED